MEDDFFAQEGLGRMIDLPLLIHDTCLGTLNIGSVQTGVPDVEEMEFLEQVASQIASAMNHVQAYEQINRLREELAWGNEYLAEGHQTHPQFWHDGGEECGASTRREACAGSRAYLNRHPDYW